MLLEHQKVWWGIKSPAIGLLGTGWLMEPQVLRWSLGAAHWPIQFTHRAKARIEAKRLTEHYKQQGWKFHPVRLLVQYKEGRA